MTRLPRDIGGDELAAALVRLDYIIVRQAGSHLRLTTMRGGEHHVTLPRHSPIHVGTLGGILAAVGAHAGMSRQELIEALFG